MFGDIIAITAAQSVRSSLVVVTLGVVPKPKAEVDMSRAARDVGGVRKLRVKTKFGENRNSFVDAVGSTLPSASSMRN